MKRIISLIICIICLSQTIFASTIIWSPNTKSEYSIQEEWYDNRKPEEIKGPKYIKGKTKEEVVYQWKEKQRQEAIISWKKYCESYRASIEKVKQENLKNYNPYVVTPIGIINK